MNAIITTILPADDTWPRQVRARMDGRPNEHINFNGKFSPLENHQEAARLLLSRFAPGWPQPKEEALRTWYSAPLNEGRMVHVFADPRRTL